jgi:16S rRNA (cytosine1402-N4)-methyltransferase
LGIEADPEMLEIAKERISEGKFVLGNFKSIDEIARNNGFENVSGILFDLGVTNLQLTSEGRGFSFANPEAELDMRVNPQDQGVKASDLLNVLREDQLTDLFKETLDRGAAGWISRKIIKVRPIQTVGDFLEVCRGLKGKSSLNEATLPFLAVRIAVNSELENLNEVLPKAYGLLKSGGRMIVISFHSGEDRIVKNFQESRLILPSEDEVRVNPRARSAKMRVIEKI